MLPLRALAQSLLSLRIIVCVNLVTSVIFQVGSWAPRFYQPASGKAPARSTLKDE